MTVSAFENIRVQTINAADPQLKEIKVSLTSGQNVSEYTFRYRAKANDTDDQLIASIKKTDSEFHSRLQSLIELSEAIQENLKGYEHASIQQDAAWNVKIYPIASSTESENLPDLHRRIGTALAQQKQQNAKLDENHVKVFEVMQKYLRLSQQKSLSEGTLSLLHSKAAPKNPPRMPTIAPTTTAASSTEKKSTSPQPLPILPQHKLLKSTTKISKKKKENPEPEKKDTKKALPTTTAQPTATASN